MNFQPINRNSHKLNDISDLLFHFSAFLGIIIVIFCFVFPIFLYAAVFSTMHIYNMLLPFVLLLSLAGMISGGISGIFHQTSFKPCIKNVLILGAVIVHLVYTNISDSKSLNKMAEREAKHYHSLPVNGRLIMMVRKYMDLEYKDEILHNVTRLIAKGADVNVRAKQMHGYTPLMIIVAHPYEFNDDNTDIARLLIGSGADVNAVTDDGKSVLQIAVSAGKLNHVILLIEQGADTSIKTSDNKTVLELAQKFQSGLKYYKKLSSLKKKSEELVYYLEKIEKISGR